MNREAPIERVVDDIIMPRLSEMQLQVLKEKTPEWAIRIRVGKDKRSFRYVPHGYVTDKLNKVFGYDWDLTIDEIEPGKRYAIQEDENGRYVAVTGRLIIRVRDITGAIITEITKSGFGSQQWLSKMEFGDALKGAKSDLLKNCATQLGIALDLYWDETAEFESYTKEQELKEMLNVPSTPVALITKAMQKFGLNMDKISEIVGLPKDEILNASPERIREIWRLLNDSQTG